MTSPNKHADFKIAIGALACILLGASACYWLARSHKKVSTIAPAAEQIEPSDPTPLTFTTLSSFAYRLPEMDGAETGISKRDPIPAPIKAFNGKLISIEGYMVPIDFKNGRTTRFLLVKDQSICCKWGRSMPWMNEWISVRMKAGAPAHVLMDQPVTVFGVLSVGELIESGEVLSIYRMEADDVAGPLDL